MRVYRQPGHANSRPQRAVAASRVPANQPEADVGVASSIHGPVTI
ncbi:hypothetical protein [Mycobacterium sp. MUNTM1]